MHEKGNNLRSPRIFYKIRQRKICSPENYKTMKLELFKLGYTQSGSTYKNITVKIDNKSFLMHEVEILDRSPGEITIAFKWDNHNFTDYYAVVNGRITNAIVKLPSGDLKLKDLKTEDSNMFLIIFKAKVV